ncbi:hypothetical protein OYC64_005394 [Pagothenia borchgrevinki]|uniref:Glutaredoxin domain-containing protein n=1 Tax=Pagothenia borchgrevinki TaxID=8213 RepID=A0ABD2GI34_PAGBO
MNSLIRNTARCLRSGAAVYIPRQADGRVWTSSARFLCAAADIQKALGDIVQKDKVVVFMKGTPAQPMCGFSNAVVQILRMHGVDDYASYNVLEDSELREAPNVTLVKMTSLDWNAAFSNQHNNKDNFFGVKAFSNWPTIPQVYFSGEFVGGCDILLQMHQNGDMVEELKKLGISSSLLEAEKESK